MTAEHHTAAPSDPLHDPAYRVPSPGPAGAPGTMAWLRASVSRFANGAEHARRRARLETLLAALDPERLERAAAEAWAVPREYIPVAVLARELGAEVDVCEATAGLVRGEETPVKATRRVGPDGNPVAVDLTGRPFGAGSRACPAREHALALVRGVR